MLGRHRLPSRCLNVGVGLRTTSGVPCPAESPPRGRLPLSLSRICQLYPAQRSSHCNNQLPELKARLPKPLERGINQRLVIWIFWPTVRPPEKHFGDALLATGFPCQYLSELAGRCECRIL